MAQKDIYIVQWKLKQKIYQRHRFGKMQTLDLPWITPVTAAFKRSYTPRKIQNLPLYVI